ncbi:MAG TPA: BamA/TamA family outer membrane protein [Puia sp.]|nr:BamA/TamA family outer membrane protein [Puia sp.]
MAKIRRYVFCALAVLLIQSRVCSQYQLHFAPVDKDSAFFAKNLPLQSAFKSKALCLQYIYDLPSVLQSRGYVSASLDSVKVDSASASVQLYVGDAFKWAQINTRHVDRAILEAVAWNDRFFTGKAMNFDQFQKTEQRLLDYMENNGYPFAKISLDSVTITNYELKANLKIDKGPLYRIDSIRVYGSAKISAEFFAHYLNIANGSIYKKEKFLQISKKIMELPYVQEQQSWTLTLLGTGCVLNLYLKPKKSSQIDALIGFAPSNSTIPGTSSKVLVTGEATINLQNALGNGESMGLNWEQIQPATPRLNLSFKQPYLFNSPFGLNASFDLFKKDSSYININLVAGIQYAATITQTSSIFIQISNSNLLTVDTPAIITSHQLPSQADYSATSLGLSYEFNNTNYRFNPVRGNEFSFIGSAGIKTIRKNATISKLIDPSDSGFSFSSLYDTIKLSSYEFRVTVAGAHYIPLGHATTLKLAFNGGLFQSPNNFLNELFLIGGYKLLRGFDEQSIYASRYAVGTLEYRYLIGQNSFLFSFADYGWADNNVPGYSLSSAYLGVGIGLAFETKAGIFNISYAIGKQDNNTLNFRQAKIHLGYVTFF